MPERPVLGLFGGQSVETRLFANFQPGNETQLDQLSSVLAASGYSSAHLTALSLLDTP